MSNSKNSSVWPCWRSCASSWSPWAFGASRSGNTVTLSAAELAAPAATEVPAEEAGTATEAAAAEETAEEAAAGEELAEVAARIRPPTCRNRPSPSTLPKRSGLQSFAYLKRFPLLVTGILLGLAFVVALLISGKVMRMPEEHTALQADLRRGCGAGHPHGLPVDPAGLLLHPL